MEFKDAVAKFFGFVRGLVQRAFDAAKANGLTDRVVADALTFARQAATQFTDNVERRDWAVAQLVAMRVPESIARIAVEAAVQLLKRELAGA